MTDKIRVAVIGAGMMGKNHLKTYKTLNNVELVGVYDIFPDAAKAAAETFGIKAFSSMEEVAANVLRVLSSFEGVLKLHKIDPIKWTIDDVLSCENLILLKLDYCLLFFDPFRYLRHFLSLCHLEDCLQACTLLVL